MQPTPALGDAKRRPKEALDPISITCTTLKGGTAGRTADFLETHFGAGKEVQPPTSLALTPLSLGIRVVHFMTHGVTLGA